MKPLKRILAAFAAAALLCTSMACTSAPTPEEPVSSSSTISSESSETPAFSSNSSSNSASSQETILEDSSANSAFLEKVTSAMPDSELKEGTLNSPQANAPAVQSKEMRAVWVPFLSLDMSKDADKSYKAFQKKYNDILAKAKNSGANALVVHVRSHGDAFYPSNYYPWTHFLSGTQGKGPGYDPLAYMVSATHQAGLEFHAWFNPLRIKKGNYPPTLASNSPHTVWQNDPAKSNWTFTKDDGIYMNPGYSQVRDYIVNGVKEVVQKYDVDGVQFDDYFYPFNVNSKEVTLDQQAYIASGSTLEIGKWRTQNVNSLVSLVYKMIKEVKPNVVFGISPQGNIANDLNAGADVYTWCSTPGYIDYICPQIYWTYDHPTAPYEKIATQWKNMVTAKDVKIYIGLALYKAGTTSSGWEKANNIISRQIQTARNLNCDGFMLYSWAYLDNAQTKAEMENVKKLLNG